MLTRAGLWNEVKNRLTELGGSLSGGQQQRLCIARALAVRPRVLLMDEPCSALDPTSTNRIEETIRDIASEVTVVIVTHNMQQAQRVSQSCAFFLAEEGQPGRVVEFGETEVMFSDPYDPVYRRLRPRAVRMNRTHWLICVVVAMTLGSAARDVRSRSGNGRTGIRLVSAARLDGLQLRRRRYRPVAGPVQRA